MSGDHGPLAALRSALVDGGGTLGELAATGAVPDAPPAGPAQLACSGPRAAGQESDYELLLEMIYEGSQLHYAEGRVLDPGDPDLGLLLGDQLYALGLARLAELGDLAAVRELADVISLVSQGALAGDDELVEATWEAGAAAIGWGSDLAHEQAKVRARGERPDGSARLRAAAALRSRH